MKLTITKLTGIEEVRWACEGTMHGQKSKVSLDTMYKAEHSPIRCVLFMVDMEDIRTDVSVHFVRHKHGVEHFVKSNRGDLYLTKEQADRLGRSSPVNHRMIINAQALITMARKRLCLKSHPYTVQTMKALRKAIKEVDPTLAKYMVPECVYRNGLCPEATECKAGLEKVCAHYAKERTNV